LTSLKSKEERREHTRVKFADQVQIYPVVESKSGNIFEVQNNPIAVKAVDLCEGGIRLELSFPKPPSQIFKLNFRIHKDKTVDVYGKTTWFSGKFLGCKFIALDAETRQVIRDFIEKAG